MDLITTDSFALVTVEALMWNKWRYGVQAHGVGSHADVEGGISYGANRLWPLIPRRRDALFDDFANDFNQVEHTGTGMMTARMDFTLEGAGDFAIVDFGVYLKCNHDSGVGAFGVSLGSAGAGGFVSALVQELRITKVIP